MDSILVKETALGQCPLRPCCLPPRERSIEFASIIFKETALGFCGSPFDKTHKLEVDQYQKISADLSNPCDLCSKNKSLIINILQKMLSAQRKIPLSFLQLKLFF
ncbi:MAG TPA: hypothetical protein DCS93_13925 [Microscillaceae bacterium]|nr:hypothetical protein [Microscillaceae bacterium]